MIWLGGAVTAVAFLFFALRRLRRYLHIYQQEEYDSLRFLRWLVRSFAFDKRVAVAIAVIALFVTLAGPILPAIWQGALAGLFILAAVLEPDPRKNAKKKLAMTKRAQRIYWTALVLTVPVAGIAAFAPAPLWWVAPLWALPLVLVLGNLILMPLESRTQRKFWNEAHAKLKRLRPTVIGITGSFGKTSVKHILGHILSMHARTLYTPGSVNTVMGNTRIIREQLKPGTRYFIAEMGAYGIGSIKRLCDLTPPDLGILTTIGEAHYERFKSLETVAQAKFELSEAVVAKEGKMIVGEEVLAQQYAVDYMNAHRDNFIICGEGEFADLKILNVEQSKDGLKVRVTWPEMFGAEEFALFAPLYGLHHGTNMALAFGAAVLAGVPAKKAIAAMATVPQIEHRLEVKPQGDGSILIDDAYNSNPSGFAAALELTDKLRNGRGRRILITPGMAELGERHDQAHAELGLKAAQCIDVALVVRPDRIPTFVDTFERRAANGRVVKLNSFAEAEDWLKRNVKEDDVVLIENDLPDILEREFRV
ncbi:Mur ligase family protein [Dichotomicrobium thermohalophilum]|uniref:UDP-N-acetylmuramoyl-tripeptide--D-alanyl-D-alanine ligase n=1 Tax=Dichotomicrobium thermohalophilum TaxID=933063 RepID=A0A397PFP4_9HYPH|nr:Mur ligase family protein [Dichotomicrobium thermohalophilum]RIA47283.1 UDP-N-acetylmuramoyl-tripeptide--D-alanyl-D-alanine ligase [Dichotomicrobium thermohalophilum]